MEWHEVRAAPDCKVFAGDKTWGAYSWNTSLFADPPAFVKSLHQARGPLGIQLGLNLHASYGIDACQTHYAAFAKAIGSLDLILQCKTKIPRLN